MFTVSAALQLQATWRAVPSSGWTLVSAFGTLAGTAFAGLPVAVGGRWRQGARFVFRTGRRAGGVHEPVQVNSHRRLTKLLQILADIGAEPEVAGQAQSAPSLDFAWGPVPDGASPTREREWE